MADDATAAERRAEKQAAALRRAVFGHLPHPVRRMTGWRHRTRGFWREAVVESAVRASQRISRNTRGGRDR